MCENCCSPVALAPLPGIPQGSHWHRARALMIKHGHCMEGDCHVLGFVPTQRSLQS